MDVKIHAPMTYLTLNNVKSLMVGRKISIQKKTNSIFDESEFSSLGKEFRRRRIIEEKIHHVTVEIQKVDFQKVEFKRSTWLLKRSTQEVDNQKIDKFS